jgi:hypothetical protein
VPGNAVRKVHQLEETDPEAEHDQREIAACARTEIDRIIMDLAEPV